MKRWIALLFMLVYSTLLAETPVAHFEGAPSGIAAGWVNVVSGAIIHSETDLVIPGVEPIALSRSPIYAPGQSFYDKYKESWNFDFRERIARREEKEVRAVIDGGRHVLYKRHDWLSVEKGYQESLVFRNEEQKTNIQLPYKAQEHAKGFTNQSGGRASAHTSIKNYSLHIDPHYNFALHCGSGEIKHYNSRMSGNRHFLTQILKPNGFRYDFGYDLDGQIQGVTLFTPSNREIVYYQMKDIDNKLRIDTDDGRWAQCEFIRERGKDDYICRLLKAVYRSDAPAVVYDYAPRYEQSGERYLSKIIYPEGRGVEFDYWRYTEKKKILGDEREFKEAGSFSVNKVRNLYQPSHPDGAMCVTHHFSYNLNKGGKGGWTDVTDCYKNKDVYRFNEDYRITEVEHWNASGQKEYVDAFTWDNDGQLLTSTTHDRSYEYVYDKRGNILEEKLHGDLTGHGKNECEKTTFSYSEDGKNLLTEERYCNGLIIKYGYKPGTDVVTEKKTFIDQAWVKTETFGYDNDHRLIESVEDDGFRKTIIRIKPLERPFGFPGEKRIYGATKKTGEQLLESYHYSYTARGEKTLEEKRDNQGNLVYRMTWEYDNHGNCIKEVNAVGDTICRTFDHNDNCIQEEGPRQDLVKKYQYDNMNRCTQETTSYQGKEVAKKQSGYDALSRCTWTTDEDGRKTVYITDRFGHPTTIFLPEVDKKQPTITQKFDPFGNVVCSIDPLGHKTEKRYTAKNKVSYIQHPDKSEERFYYTLDGQLKESIDQEDNHTFYVWDALGRLLSKQTPFGRETYTYTGLLLARSVDLAEVATDYRYDLFGRLIEKNVDARKECLAYDVHGLPCKKSFYEGTTLLSTEVTIRNALEQVIESYTEDPSGAIFQHKWFTYDGAGNCVEEREDSAITKKVYDGRNRVIELVNPLKQTYRVDYRLVGQEREKTVTDPLGNKVITLYNTHNQESVIRHLDTSGNELSKRCLFYDLSGQLIKEEKTAGSETQTIAYERDAMGRVTALTEPLGKVTISTYTPLGNLESKTKPDGMKLLYCYQKGRLISLTSSDGKINYHYTYAPRGELTHVEEGTTGHISKQSYSPHSDLLKEVLPTGQTILYTYDGLGRLTSYNLPDGGKVILTYNAINATSVSRQDASGNVLYTHAYTQFNHRGDVTEQKLIGDGGTIFCAFDIIGQLTKLVHPHRKEENIRYDDVGNLSAFTLNNTPHHFVYDSLYQLIEEDEHRYTFDAFRNRLSKDGTSYEVNTLNEIISDGSTKFAYDDNGNIICSGTLQFGYDPLNRLLFVKKGEIEVRFAYDPFNRRISRNGIPYYYCKEHEIGNGHSLRILGIGLGGDIGATIAIELDSQVFAPLHDHNGSITALLDSEGNLIESWSYTAFGEQQGKSLSPWTFSSKRFDPLTGHLSFGQRDYDPTIGRWTTPDPLGFEAGPNLYTYVDNQPLTKRDPLGLFALPSLGMWDSMLVEKNMANLSSDRFQGGMRAMGGFVEGSVGAGLFATPSFGAGQFVGGLMIVHGYDNFQSGLRQAYSGSYQEPATIPFLKGFGFSHETAHLAHEGFGIFSTVGGGMQLGLNRASTQMLLPNLGNEVLKDGAAYSSRQSYLLKTHLSQLEDYGVNGYRQLQNGRLRYYGETDLAKTNGEMIGRRLVREWDPKSGMKRTWHETMDKNGNVRIVRPETNDGNKIHYIFDTNGKFVGVK